MDITNAQVKKPSSAMTPLWVISLFVSLTEVVTGIAVTRATGAIQIALTTFVILFPLLVASIFFLILWHKPFVFYPPADFAGGVNVQEYVRAMTSKVEIVRADVLAEAENIRASAVLESEAITRRIEAAENEITELMRSREDAARLLESYVNERNARASEAESERSSFDQNSQYRVHIVSVTKEAPITRETKLVNELAAGLRKIGFKTSEGGWGSTFFFPDWESSTEGDALFMVYRDTDQGLINRLKSVLSDLVPDVPIHLMHVSEAVASSSRTGFGRIASDYVGGESSDLGPPENVGVTVAYCMRRTQRRRVAAR